MPTQVNRSKWITAIFILCLGACQKSDTRILIGATTITKVGAAPIPGSVIVIAGKTIRAVGLQKDVPIPQDSERTDLSGKWVIPPPGGQIAPGAVATFDVLDAAPPSHVDRHMVNGEWQGGH